MVPIIGSLNGSPPAKGLPPGAVWQAAQSAARVRYSPRATKSALARFAGGPVGSDPLKSASATRSPLEKAVGSPERSAHHPAATIAARTIESRVSSFVRLIQRLRSRFRLLPSSAESFMRGATDP